MYYSYVMGISKKIYALKGQGFKIKRSWQNYKVAFEKDKINIWEAFIAENLQVGYWNEYLTENAVVFIFKLQDGIHRYEIYDFDNQEVLGLCRKLCNCNFSSIKNMLEGNRFYKKILTKRYKSGDNYGNKAIG